MREGKKDEGMTMNTIALLELAAKWEKLAEPPIVEDGSEEARVERAADSGRRSGFRYCAEELRLLVKLLGARMD